MANVEADVTLSRACNFDCSYCSVASPRFGGRVEVAAGNEAWQRAFDDTGRSWHLHFTGGEPFLYPEFLDLLRRLCGRHVVSVNTNLSLVDADALTRNLPARGVRYIHGSLHGERRRSDGDLEALAARVRAIADAGFTIFLSQPMTPEFLADGARAFHRWRDHGLRVIPKVLRGLSGGRRFPGAYTAAEKEAFRRAAQTAQRDYEGLYERLGGPPTVDVLSDERFLDGVPSFRGRLCRAGSDFMTVEPSGDAYRCGRNTFLGNLLTGTLRLLDEPVRCRARYCPYYCTAYSLPGTTPGSGLACRLLGALWERVTGLRS